MILLDTNAIIWLLQRHKRARALERRARLYMSPASLLELQFLLEAGRIAVSDGDAIAQVTADPRWQYDEPPAGPWFAEATELGWTRDPFDRLLVAHARVRRWKLATGDQALLSRLPGSDVIPL
ncbi:MAG TPA: PIN domain-containing protein [Vicinamibacterales bacterium]|nr:PIN domain-containing protein [Vicinamibacterales bacterium]